MGKSRKTLAGAVAVTSLLMPGSIGCEVEKEDNNGGSGDYENYTGVGYNDGSSVPNCIWCGYRKEGDSAMYLDHNKCGAGMMCAQTTGGVICTPDDWSDYTCNPGSGPYYPTVSRVSSARTCLDECIVEEKKCYWKEGGCNSDGDYCWEGQYFIHECEYKPERGAEYNCNKWYAVNICEEGQSCSGGMCL